MIKNCIAETELYSVFIDSNEKPNKDMEDFLEKLPSEVKRLMDFFGITSIEKKITINIHTELEEFIQYYESLEHGHYQDYVVGCALNCEINLVDFKEYEKTQCHHNDTVEDFLKVIVHEVAHICHQNLQPDMNKVAWFMGEGLATYLADQAYQKDERIDFPKEVYFGGPEAFQQIRSPYCFAQKFVRMLVEKFPHEKVLEYACDADKIKEDWDLIWG